MDRTETITNDLRRAILEGTFGPGDRLLEIPLSQEYRCGRAAVRSALLELATEGLVEREANRGATVRRISVAEAIQITEARSALESLVASHAARNANGRDREELESIIADMRSAVTDERSDDYSDLNGVLHRRLREVSRHKAASQLITMLRNQAAHHQYRLAAMPGRPAESLEQHAAIVAAVVSGDEIGAAEAMQGHLASVIDVLSHWNDE